MITSLESIKNKCGDDVSINKIRSALKRFENLEFITNKSTKINRLITIVNWNIYQSMENQNHKDNHNQTTKKPQSDHN
jgi:hypothetical protein